MKSNFLLALVALWPLAASADPPPVNSPDWIITHDYSADIANATNPSGRNCCNVSDGRPLNSNSVRYDRNINLYQVRFNRLRWMNGTVSETPAEREQGDVWLNVTPGKLTFDFRPKGFTMAWVGWWLGDNVQGIPSIEQELYCFSMKDEG